MPIKKPVKLICLNCGAIIFYDELGKKRCPYCGAYTLIYY